MRGTSTTAAQGMRKVQLEMQGHPHEIEGHNLSSLDIWDIVQSYRYKNSVKQWAILQPINKSGARMWHGDDEHWKCSETGELMPAYRLNNFGRWPGIS